MPLMVPVQVCDLAVGSFVVLLFLPLQPPGLGISDIPFLLFAVG